MFMQAVFTRCVHFLEVFDMQSSLTFTIPFQLKIGTPVTSAQENIIINLDFSTPFFFLSYDPYGTDRWTDGRARPVMQPIRTAAQ